MSGTHRLYKRYFEVTYQDLGKRGGVWDALVSHLQRHVPSDAAVLDLGAGYCVFINRIKAGERHALDLNPRLAEHCAPGVMPHVGDVSDLSMFRDGTLDVVFASNLLEHLDDEPLAATLAEVHRVLRSGGRFIVMQPNFTYAYRNYFDDFTHRRIFTHVSLRDVLRAEGFDVEVIRPRFLPYSMRSSLPAHPLLVKLYLWSPIKPFAGQMLLVVRKP
ncbi:MAG: class I SAM-dependent methyltransferase [Flavobacteriales bacterium]|nr:class I SAM-dependent methyltransferase [Flavobacteriales bacterium]